MNKTVLIAKFKKVYLDVHGTKCKDLMLEDWTLKQLKNGIKTLNFIVDREK